MTDGTGPDDESSAPTFNAEDGGAVHDAPVGTESNASEPTATEPLTRFVEWTGFSESEQAASDSALAETLAIDDAADTDDVAGGLPLAASPAPARRGRHLRHHKTPLDLSSYTHPDDQTDRTDETGETGDAGSTSRRARRRARRKAPWWELPILVLFAILVAVLVKTFVVQPFYIPSQSMEQTLHGCPGCSGDRILVNKTIYDLRDPHPGDIVVFNAPPGWNDEPPTVPPSNPIERVVRGFGQLIGFVPPDGLVLVKRVIATGGQTVEGVSGGPNGTDIVKVSDHGDAGPWRTLDEPFTYYDGPDPRAVFGPVTVPKGRLWVMGDHRNDSADSRFHCNTNNNECGPDADPMTSTVPISDIIGKAFVIAWPPSRWRTLGTPSTFEHTALAAADAVPVLASTLLVVPVFFLRRRRRRRRPRPSPST